MTYMRVIIIGDVVGEPGRALFKRHIAALRSQYRADAVIVNGENSAQSGRGIKPNIVAFFKDLGVDVITSGNHIWHHKEIYTYLEQHNDLLRPANFPHGAPGTGVTIIPVGGHKLGVINLQGRVFMREMVADPLREAETILTYVRSQTNNIVIDFHAEATSEKLALAYSVDGKVSAVVGTHTHVQTADERILPGGTAYITDLGMTGTLNSMLGMQKEGIIRQFKTQMPTKFMVDTESTPYVLSGVCVSIDTATGLAHSVERIRIIDSHEVDIQE